MPKQRALPARWAGNLVRRLPGEAGHLSRVSGQEPPTALLVILWSIPARRNESCNLARRIGITED